MEPKDRVALDELVFQYQLLHKNEVVYIGRSNNPSARMMEHWKDGKKFDRIEIAREEPTPLWQADQIEKERIARYQIEHGRPPQYNKDVPLPVKEGTRLPAPKEPTPTFVYWNGRRTTQPCSEFPDAGENGDDESTQHYLIGRKTACGLWKGNLAATRQPNQVTCGNCRVTDLFRSEFDDVDDDEEDEDWDEEDWDEPTQHYFRNNMMTACGLRKKNGAVETTRQRGQVTCLRCRDTKRFRDDY